MNIPLNSNSPMTPAMLVETGEAFYENHLKAMLEPDHFRGVYCDRADDRPIFYR